MRRFPHLVLILVALLWVPSLLRAAPDRELRATDRAHAALADGDPARAVGLLRSAVRAVGDRTSKQRLRCLLGSALLADDDPGQAEAVLSRVPLDAPCGPRAAFLRAHALVALGRARDANEIHDRVGGPKLADDRDGDSAEAVAAIARKLLADPDRGRTQGMSILARTLGLRIGPERRFALARELVDTMRQDRTQRPDGGAMAEGCRAMVDALTAEDSGADRLRAAAVCTVDQAWQILSGLPPSPQRDLAMAEQIKGAGADVLRERALQRLSGDELTTLRQELGAARVAQGRLDATALLDEAPSADGERLAAGVLARAGREADAVARLDSHLQQYRSDPHRAEVLAARADLVLGLARRAAARGEHDEARRWYDELLQEHPEHTDGALAAYEAGLAARAAGDLDDARERFDRVLARWPESSAAPFAVAARARMALDDSDDSEAAFELMRRMGSRLRAAVDVAAELRATRLRIDGPGQVTRDPRVRIGVRNVETLKVALHSIDADAYVRAGQQPEDLRELDVGVVGADRTWTEPVPDYRPHADLSFDLPIEVPGPGLYTVTVSADDREARTLLLVSDLRLVAKAVGGELAVAAFDAEGRPAPGTEVLLVSGDKTREGRTDGTGLWRTPHVPRGETVLLGRRRGSPALLTLSTTQQQRMEIDLTLYTELERPLARPGSDMGIRVVARRGPSPVRGEWTLWLAQGDRNLSPWKATSDGRGVLHTQLPIPPIAASRYEILAVPPGQAERVSLGSVSVGSGTDAEAARTMTASIDEAGDGVVEVWQPDGTPAAGVVVRNGADGPTATTDSAGRATFAGPAATIPWTLNAQLVGSSHTARASRQPPERVQLRLTAEQDRLRPGERPRLALHGEGAVRVELSRLIEVATPAEAPVDPWLGPEPEPGPRGAVQWTGAPAASEVVEERVRQLEVTASEDGVPLDLPVLEPGRWRVRAMHADGWAHAAMMDLSVSISELRLVGVGDASLGERLTLGAQGEAALVTASNDRLLYAAVHGGTSRGVVTIDPQWAGDVDVTAVAPSGAVHHRDIRVDTALHVALTTEPVPGGVRVTATVTDGAGRPAAAQVALAGWDTRMERFAGAPRQLPADALRFARAGGPLVTGVTVAWEDGDPGSEIHPALLQEVRRLAEREKARNAISGLLSDNNLARAMLEDVPVPHGIGGLGTSGYGSGGGGGFGSGHGGLGQIAGRPGSGTRLGVAGADRVLWSVAQTDASGRMTAVLQGPASDYRVRATAIGASVGIEQLDVTTRDRVWLATHAPTPGFPGDQVTPSVTVVNGQPTPFTGAVRLADREIALQLDPGQARTVSFDDATRGPGPEALAIAVQDANGNTVAQDSWRFDVGHGVHTEDAETEIATVVWGPRGGFPYATLALQPDPALVQEPWRHASRGRAALAALPYSDDPRLARAVRDARDVLRLKPARPTPEAAATALIFLAELRESGRLPITTAELEAEAAILQSTPSVDAVAWAAAARARAGLPVDANLLAFLDEAELTPRQAGLHAQALAALDRPGPTLVGRGLWAAVAASARGGTVDARQLRTDGPPPVGDPMRADWIRLAGTPRLQTTTTRATVRVEGEAVATLDLTRGGLARVAATGAVDVDAPGAVVLRSSLPPIGDVPLSGLRVPRHPSGRPWSQAVPRDREAQSLVGCNPCVVAVGEAVRLPGHVRLPVGWSSPGVRAEGRGSATVLHTSAPASVQLRGIEASDGSWSEPLRIEVRAEAESPLHPLVRLEMAEVATARGQVPDLSDLTDVPEGRLALVGLTSALQAEDEAAIVEHFMRLVAVQPSTPLSLGDVATVARAMATQGRHEGAARVWRAGLDAAFNAEAAGLNQLEGAVGTLATSKLIRDTAQRYPDGNAVGEALYLLPTELRSMAGSQLDETVVAAGITAMDLRLTAAAWDREFLALNRDHDRAPAAGLRLARSLLTLGAPERATNWARAIARAHPDDPLVDALTYLEALARTESEQPGAETLLKRLVDEPFPNQMGTLEPSTHRSEAQLVLGRLYEARGQVDRALQAYGVIAADVPEAARSVTALEARRIEIPALVRVMPGQPATLETELQGIDELQIRVYSVDLKSIFLRDQGLSEVRDMPVAGVSPTWAATRRVGVGPFPVQRTLTLPLSDRGAWLVHLEGDGVRASSLVVRSGLKLAVSDHTGVRRVTVQRDGRPAPGVEVRALARGRVDSATTDVRGVAEVGAGSPVFAFDEEHVAFTDPDADPSGSARPAPAAQALPLKQLDSRLGSEQAKDQETYRRRFKSQASEELMLNAL